MSARGLQTSCATVKSMGEARRIVHVFSPYPFRDDVAVLLEARRELCSVGEVPSPYLTGLLLTPHY